MKLASILGIRGARDKPKDGYGGSKNAGKVAVLEEGMKYQGGSAVSGDQEVPGE